MLPKSALSLATILLLSVTSAQAMKFEALGYKSVSMGGAAVASSSGSHAAYNNPALLAKQPYAVEVSLGAGVSATDHGAGAAYSDLSDSGFFDLMDKISEDSSTITQEEGKVLADGRDTFLGMNENGIAIAPQIYLGAQVYGFGFGIYEYSDVLATTLIDPTHDQLIFEKNGGGYTKINDDGSQTDTVLADYEANSIQYAMDNGDTYIDTTAIAIAEVPLAYGHNFETKIGNIMVGGAVKYMQAITYTQNLTFEDSKEDGEKFDKQSSNFGIDLGLAYQPSFSYDLTFGLVAKNLNSPTFDFYTGEEYTLDPMVRAGLAYNITESLQIASDIDITSNSSLYDGYESQMLGGGIIYEPFSSLFALSLRGGLMQNLHSSDVAGITYTAGLGIGVKWFQIDLSGEMASKSNEVDGTSVPQYAKASVALISRW